MHYRLFFIVALLSLDSLAACKKPQDPPAAGSGSGSGSGLGPIPTLLDGATGSVIRNGLLPEVYHDQKAVLEARMGESLASPPSAPFKLSPKFKDPPPVDDKLIDYAVDCAVSDAVDAPSGPLHHKGALSNTNDWPQRPLGQVLQRADLHACIATRLNPTGKEVDIFLSGAQVKATDNSTGFEVAEALWTKSDQGYKIYVWPLEDVDQKCDDHGVPALRKRICGAFPGMCDLEVGNMGACKKTGSIWNCPIPGHQDREVIETRLKCSDWCTLYPTCRLPAACKDVAPCPEAPPDSSGSAPPPP